MKMPELKKDASQSVQILVVAALPGTAVAALRLIYEETIMTWHEGDQMVGFTMMHVFPYLYLILLASLCLAHIALLSALAVSVGRWFRGLPAPKWNKLPLIGLCVLTGLVYVPYHIWKRATIALKGPGPHAAQFLVYAAADGDRPTVKLLLERGVPVDVLNGDSTALNAACARDQIKTARFLLSKGADVGLAPECKGKLSLLYRSR
jgi:hypothetical protein